MSDQITPNFCFIMTMPDLITAVPQWKQLIHWDFKSLHIHPPPYSPDLAPCDFFFISKDQRTSQG